MGRQRIHRLLIPPDLHQRRRQGQHRPDPGAGVRRFPQLQDIHDLDSSSQSADAEQQDRLWTSDRDHAASVGSRRHAARPLRGRRHGPLQLRQRTGGRPLGLVEHALHPYQPLRGRVIQARDQAGVQDRVPRVLRPRERRGGRRIRRTGPYARTSSLWRDAAQLRLLQRR